MRKQKKLYENETGFVYKFICHYYIANKATVHAQLILFF